MLRFGIDLGGTKIELCALADGEERYRQRIATPAHDYAALVEAIAQLVERAEHALGQRGSVGICTPGALSRRTGAIKNSNTQCLNGQPLDRDLAARLAREIRIENDANCFALSEAVDGAGRGAEIVFGVILGTGVGGGLVVRGRSLVGCNAIAGEWGHNPLPYPEAADDPATPCYCGRLGCVETYLCGRGLLTDYLKNAPRQPDARPLPPPTAAGEVAERAAAGEPLARDCIERYAQRLARALAVVINVVDPDVIVLGGGLSKIDTLYTRVPELLPRFVFSDGVSTRLSPAQHGDASGVRGAAWLWP